MRTCTDFETFTDLWYTFLTATKNIYTAIKNGSKSAQDRQWFGAKDAERRNDELLQYLFQARDDDEHGLDMGAEHVRGSIGIGARREGFATGVRINFLRIDGRGNAFANLESIDGLPIAIEQRPPHIALRPVTGRGPVVYAPPTKHKGHEIDGRYPEPVARLALAYFEELVGEAESRA